MILKGLTELRLVIPIATGPLIPNEGYNLNIWLCLDLLDAARERYW